MMLELTAQHEIETGDRFSFGGNWSKYLKSIDDEKIQHAKIALKTILGDIDLAGKSFLDIGSGSGIHSLAACSLGAKVYSMDFDMKSVDCTSYLRDKFYGHDQNWQVAQGSVLDQKFIKSLGKFDVVYSWGVLHHTGDMYNALDIAQSVVADNGILFIAIYNDQGSSSKYWTFVKKTYNKYLLAKYFWSAFYLTLHTTKGLIKDILHFKNPFVRYTEYKMQRGMSIYYDIFDWIGGYPFEVATPEQIFDYYREKGYTLIKMKTCAGGSGCNEFIFKKNN